MASVTGMRCAVLLLQGIVPREAAVHVLMGRLFKRLRNPDAALTSFNIGEPEPCSAGSRWRVHMRGSRAGNSSIDVLGRVSVYTCVV